MQNKFKILSTVCVSALLTLSTNAQTQNNQLNDIIVTAKSNSTADNIASTVQVIDRETIQKSGAGSVAEILKTVAGFSWTTNSSSINGRRNIGIRGMDSERILILIDGERANDTDSFIGHSNFKISHVDLNSIERIEIIKGPGGSVLYGSEAIGGVINLISKHTDGKLYNRLKISASKVNGRNGGNGKNIAFTSAFGNEKTSVKISLNKEDTDPIKFFDSTPVINRMGQPTGEVVGDNTKFESQNNRNIDFSLVHKFTADNKFGISLFDGNEERNLIDDPYYDIDRAKYSLFYQTKFGNLNAKFKIYQNETNATWLPDFGGGAAPYYTHKIKDKINSAEIFGKIADNQYLTAGVEQHKSSYTQDRANPASADYSAEDTTQKSIYVQDKITLNNGVIIAGIRFDDNSQFGNGTSPALGYVQNLAGNKKLKLSYAKAFKTPNIKEADSNYLFSSNRGHVTEFIGNANLKPETSNNFEMSFSDKGDGFDYSMAIFHNKIKDLIESVITQQTMETTNRLYSNIGNVTTKGVEFSLNFDLNNTLLLNTSYNYLKTDDGNGAELTYRPDHTMKIKLDKDFSDSFNTNIFANYNGKSVNSNQDKVANYTTFDLAVNKKLNKTAKLQFAINNLTDEKLDDASDNHLAELVGREYKLSMTFNF